MQVKNTTEYYKSVGNYFDLFAEKHLGKSEDNPILTDMRNSFRTFVTHPNPRYILDIGCGPGQDVAFFAEKYPLATIFGIDVSGKMIACAESLVAQNGLNNSRFYNTGIEQLEDHLAAGIKFDVIYVFFGALNTVSSLKAAADIIERLLNDQGQAVLTFVNKYYLSESLLNLVKLNFKGAFARWGETWRGYSPAVPVSSKTYTPAEITSAFSRFKLQTKKGYSIFYPAWFQAPWLTKFPALCNTLKKWDVAANSSPLWKFGEYTLFVYSK